MVWLYNGREFTEDDINEAYGFVYEIKNLANGRKYIGRKYFTQAGTKQVNGKRKKIRKTSNWENYWGSNKKLLEEMNTVGRDAYQRTILYLCYSRSDCSYWETYEIFKCHALIGNDYYNDWVSCKIRKAHLKSTI